MQFKLCKSHYIGEGGERESRQFKENYFACLSSQQTCSRMKVQGKCKSALPLVDLSSFTVCEHYTLRIYKLTCLYREVYTKPYVIYQVEDLYRLSGSTLTLILFNIFTH